MAGGIRGPAKAGYTQTEYSQPWGGIDLSKPASQIDPGSCVSLSGSIVRGALTHPPIVGAVSSSIPVVQPVFMANEKVLATANFLGVTVLITSQRVLADWMHIGFFTQKNFNQEIFSGLNLSGHVGTLLIGNALYFSSSSALGVYKIDNTFTVTEITAQNGSGPFIGGDFLFTISERLCLANIIGGDGNQTGGVTSATVTNGGTGYPATGDVTFTGGGGSGATGTFTSTGGVITSIAITAAGTGYLSAPTLSIVGTTGSGFSGTATISSATTPSTTTKYPDYVAASFPSAFGNFDPNSILLGGFFSQLTEARGLITGIAVFESVGVVAHNGGFTEMVPNTSSSVGSNIEPFTFAPLWSSDQGVVCRYGSMAQYGAMCCFLGFDQPYTLSPSGLSPFGDKVASLLQAYSIWNNPLTGPVQQAGGLFGSIIEVEGEKHYLIAFVQSGSVNLQDQNPRTQIFDCLLKQDSWSLVEYDGAELTSPIYQTYDWQELYDGIHYNLIMDNWILFPFLYYVSGSPTQIVGQLFFDPTSTITDSPFPSTSFSASMRFETPTMAIPQTTRRILVEYENFLGNDDPATLTFTIYGQIPPVCGVPSGVEGNVFTMTLPNVNAGSPAVPSGLILTALSEPLGTAITTTSTAISFTTPDPIRIVRIAMIAETEQMELA